jgi:hypothetical protein
MSGERNAPADNPSLRSILSADPEISKLYYEISLINSLNKLGITSDQAATILDIIQSSRESIDSDYNRLKMNEIEELKQELDSVLQGAELDPGRITKIRPVSYFVESQQVILNLSPVRIRVLDTLTPEQQSNINQCLAIYGDDTSGIAGQEGGMNVIHGTYRTGADASQTSADVERALDEMILNQTTVEALRLYIDSK